MRLRRVQVQNYRSIVDSGIVAIEDKVTVLVGKNEQGKTTFLRALASFVPKVAYGPGDLPNHLRPNLVEQPAETIPIVTIWIAPELEDRAVLIPLVADIDSIKEFKITKFYDGHRSYEQISTNDATAELKFAPPDLEPVVGANRKLLDSLKAKLRAHAARLPEFVPQLAQAEILIDQYMAANLNESDQIDNLVKTFSTALTSLTGQDAPIQEEIGAAVRDLTAMSNKIKKVLEEDKKAKFESVLPNFAFHSTRLDQIPNEVNIAEFIKSPETVSRGMANLCGVAGLSMQKIQELASTADSSMRVGYEDHFRAKVSGAINDAWTQEEYAVFFVFSQDRMSVMISDETYDRRIPPQERSDGFQWFLSFYTVLQNEISRFNQTIFLLDNPGLELHADGQRDIKKILEEKLPASVQVIYVTHSAAMIDAFSLEQVRQVELNGNMLGTTVTRLPVKEGDDFDLLEPVRMAIGASLASSLVYNEFNVLVEGAADKPILEGAIKAFHGQVVRKILVNGSVSDSKDGWLIRFFQRANLPFVVYIDADSGGRDLRNDLLRWGVPEEKIIDAAIVLAGVLAPDFELEDIVGAELYHEAVKQAYPGFDVKVPDAQGLKITKKYSQQFKDEHSIQFTKRRVSDKIKEMLVAGNFDSKKTANLQMLTGAIVAALENQVNERMANTYSATPVMQHDHVESTDNDTIAIAEVVPNENPEPAVRLRRKTDTNKQNPS